ncbi:MAG: M23 family metallopeptidase [Rhodanobacteraceae bacterium]
MTRHRLAVSAVFGLLTVSIAAAPRDTVTLPAYLQQGQLVIARAPPGSHVRFGGRELRVGSDGHFVFGLDRDAPRSFKLDIRYPDGHNETVQRTVTQRTYRVERVNGLPQKTVTPDPATAARIAREQQAVAEARTRDDPRENFLDGFERPVKNARISGVYGSQRIDNGVPKSPHMGLDMAVPTGTPVHAPAAGIVTFAEPDLVLTGGTVLIDHGFGLDSSFLHMSRLDVKRGDHVKQGQIIGAAGMTGRATGPHVHWGFNWFGVRLDPALLPKTHR